MASSPPSSKKQKTLHFPTPSRRRGPRQTSLNSFLTSSPTAVKKTTSAKSTTPKAKNGSILNFFKPVPGSGGKNKQAHKDDALFLATGGYELELSEPEDEGEEDGEVIEELRRRVKEEVRARERMVTGGLEMQEAGSRGSGDEEGWDEDGNKGPVEEGGDTAMDTKPTHDRKRCSPSEEEEVEEASPYFATKPAPVETTKPVLEEASKPAPRETEKPPDEAPEVVKKPADGPKFDPSALKLNLSSSMLFSKKLAVGQGKP